MSSVLVLVSGDQQKHLSQTDISDVQSFLFKHNIQNDALNWLHPDKAAEIYLSAPLGDDVWRDIRTMMDSRAIDVFCTSAFNRRKKLLLADMDATIVTGETLDDLAASAGLKDKISAITERAMRGELDFQSALVERVAMLSGLSVFALADTLGAMTLHAGAEDLIRVMRQNGAECYLVSGGFTYFTGAIAARCGFNGHHGNILEIQDGKLTGQVVMPILDKDAKSQFLRHYRDVLSLSIDQTLAVGDGANDIPMLVEAGLGVGFHPKPKVKEAVQNWVVHTDLTSLLYIQGYTWQDIAS